MADQPDLKALALWLKQNADKAGSPEFVQAANRYRELRQSADAVDFIRQPQDAGADLMGPAGRGLAAGANEFLDNYTMGLGDYVRAGASYLTLPGTETPLDNMDFYQRRDAYREARNQQTEEALPGFVDDALSLAGVLTSAPAQAAASGVGLPLADRFARGASAGLGYGVAEGVGNSRGRSIPKLASDAAAGGAIGTAGGLAAEGLASGVGAAARRVLGRPGNESRELYDALMHLDVPPTVGAIGGRTASTLENTFAQNPISPAKLFPATNLTKIQSRQAEGLESAIGQETAAMRGSSTALPATTSGDASAVLRRLAEEAGANIRATRQGLEDRFSQIVPPDTPVRVNKIRQVPEDLRRQSRDVGLQERATSDVQNLLRNPGVPVNNQRAVQLANQRGVLEGQMNQIDSQLATLSGQPGSDQQIRALGRTRSKLATQLRRVDKLIERNTGRTFQATRDWRTGIGKGTEQSGLQGYEKDVLYEPTTRALERAGGKEFKDLTAQERKLYAAEDAISGYMKDGSPISRLKSAIRAGRLDEVQQFKESVPKEKWAAAMADFVDDLGRSPRSGGDFSFRYFANNWRSLPDEAKTVLVDDVEARAALDVASDIAKAFEERGGTFGSSFSGIQGGTLANVWLAMTNPAKWLSTIAGFFGVEAGLASKELAKAVAKYPTATGAVTRAVGVTAPTSLEKKEEPAP